MNQAQGKLAAALDVSSLPAIPHVLLQFLEACSATEVSFDRLSAIVEHDAALSSKVIAAANAPVYAQWGEIKEFNRVLVVLGLNTVKTIAITPAAQQFFSRFAQGGDGLREAAFTQGDQLFGLSQSLLEDLLRDVQAAVREAAEGMGIPIPSADAPPQGEAPAPERDPLQLELAKRVRDFALVNGVVQQLGKLDSLDAVLAAIHRDLGILFGLSRSLFFLYRPEQDRLQGVHAGGVPLVDELSIPLSEGRSLVAMALRQRRAVHAFEAALAEHLTVVDRQVARLLGNEGILCLPLVTDGFAVGTLVVGIDRARLEHHSAQLSLLELFSAEAAGTIARQQAVVETERRIIENERALYEARTRMLVHEASNPLAIVHNYLHVLGMKLGDQHPVREELEGAIACRSAPGSGTRFQILLPRRLKE